MYIPLRGCCTDNPGTDPATARQIFMILTWVFGGATALVLALNAFLH
jgi:hypothetical protein